MIGTTPGTGTRRPLAMGHRRRRQRTASRGGRAAL